MTPPHQNRARLAPVVSLVCGLAGGSIAAGGCNRVIDAVQSQQQDCAARPSDPDCAPTPWPIPGHSANSDPWIISHHDVITQMSPRVLVLNFFNNATSDAATATAQRQIAAIAEGSRYHGYSDSKAPIFLSYQIAKVVDLTDRGAPPPGWTFPSSSKLPVTPSGNFDPLALFTSPQLSQAYGFLDAKSGRSLTLCELFEQGAINEVWVEDGESGSRRVPLNLERKQEYTNQNQAIAGTFDPCVGGSVGGCLQDLICGVTVRIAHLDPARGPGCDLEVRGWGIEGMWDALPAFAPAAATFLNRDFDTRFGMQFDGWENLCDSSGDPCVSYPNPTTATGTYNGTPWTISPFTPACGSPDFPPNARSRWDWTNNTSPVQSSCEHFGLGDGIGGADAMEFYTSDKITAADQAYPDCGGGWQIHWRQSIPGLNNQAKTKDGAPMRNWWPLLFY